jgi:hypothetical protein
MTDRPRWNYRCFCLLVLIASIQLLTMPKFLYPGDAFASRAEASDLIRTGSLGIASQHRQSLADMVSERGQYFFENDHQQKFYSKFGVGNALLYVPPLLVEYLWTGSPPGLLHNTRRFILILNVYQILFTLVATAYLYRAAEFYTTSRWLPSIFVLISVYGTFLWFYLRAPTHEVFQVTAMVGFYYHSILFLRRSRDSSSAWPHLLASTLYVGCLMLLKLFYALLLVPLCALIILAETPWKREPASAGRRSLSFLNYVNWAGRQRYLGVVAVPTALLGLLILATNFGRYGSPLETGYSQWRDPLGQSYAFFDASVLFESVPALLYEPGNANAFFHYPLWLFGAL